MGGIEGTSLGHQREALLAAWLCQHDLMDAEAWGPRNLGPTYSSDNGRVLRTYDRVFVDPSAEVIECCCDPSFAIGMGSSDHVPIKTTVVHRPPVRPGEFRHRGGVPPLPKHWKVADEEFDAFQETVRRELSTAAAEGPLALSELTSVVYRCGRLHTASTEARSCNGRPWSHLSKAAHDAIDTVRAREQSARSDLRALLGAVLSFAARADL